MKIDEVFCNTFKALRHELGHDRPKDQRPLWQRRLSTASAFCQALVANGYLTEEQMQRAAERYRLGQTIHLSPVLEQRATKAQKAAKIDLVDLLFP